MPQALIYINEELDKKIEALSKQLNKTKVDVVVNILEDYFKQKGRKDGTF